MRGRAAIPLPWGAWPWPEPQRQKDCAKELEEGPGCDWPVTQCPQCGGQAYIVSASNTSATTLDCENCGTIVVQEDK